MFEYLEDGDFDESSATVGKCYVSGCIRAPHEKGIFRGPYISHEGYLDVSEQAIKDAALCIGWTSPERVETLIAEHEELVEQYVTKIAELEAKLEGYMALQEVMKYIRDRVVSSGIVKEEEPKATTDPGSEVATTSTRRAKR